MRARLVPWIAGGALLVSGARAASATFSLSAVDLSTGEVGVAAASCIAPAEVSIVYGPVPGRGIVVAQSFLHEGTLARGMQALRDGNAPEDVMASLLDPAFDPEGEKRQLAVIDLTGAIAVHTGDQALAFASHRRYAWGATRFTVQGNRLTGPDVLDRMAAAFMETDACDLTGRLVTALLAAPAPGEGDASCTGDGIPADSAFVGVDRDGAAPVKLMATARGVDPMPAIARALDTLRATHRCPPPPEPPPPPPPDEEENEAATSSCQIQPADVAHGPRELGLLLGLGLWVRRARRKKNAVARTRGLTGPAASGSFPGLPQLPLQDP